MVKHEIPQCQKCQKYMTLRFETKDRFENRIFVYYCDNRNCGNNKTIEVVEFKD